MSAIVGLTYVFRGSRAESDIRSGSCLPKVGVFKPRSPALPFHLLDDRRPFQIYIVLNLLHPDSTNTCRSTGLSSCQDLIQQEPLLQLLPAVIHVLSIHSRLYQITSLKDATDLRIFLQQNNLGSQPFDLNLGFLHRRPCFAGK